VLHVEGEAFFFEIESALADALVFLAKQEAGDVLEGSVIEVGTCHGVDGVGLGKDLESAFGIASAFGIKVGDEFGGHGDFFGEFVFMIEAMEDAETEFGGDAPGAGLGGKFDDFAEGEAAGKPVENLFVVLRWQLGDSVIGA
jgi:hypothetical protein